jgi:hypothetical protein
MTSKIAKIVAKYLAREVKKFSASDEPDRGELLGKYKITPVGNGLFWCELDARDPLRYRDEKTGLEFSPALGAFKTDKGSIPKIVQRVKALGLQLKEDDAERSYLIHDSAYQSGTVRVRKSGADWSPLTLTREQADVLMHDCFSADSTPEGKPISRATAFAVYQASTAFFRRAVAKVSCARQGAGSGGGYDPYRKPNGFEKVNPTPGTTRNRIVGKNGWRTLAEVPDALTEAGRRYAINFSR